MSYDLERQRRNYGKLRYLLDLHVVQRAHKQYLDDFGDVAQELRGDYILRSIKGLRDEAKEDRKLSFRKQMASTVHGAFDTLLKMDSNNTRPYRLFFDGKPSAFKYNQTYKRTYGIEIHIGWMWRWKVWRDVYNEGKTELPYLIISADRVRVNNKLMHVYEVLSYDIQTDLTKTGYVAVTKESRKGFYHMTASVAINRAMGQIETEVNKLFTRKENEDD